MNLRLMSGPENDSTTNAMRGRATALLAAYLPLTTSDAQTIWGPYRCFDGLFLAQFASAPQRDGNGLLAETLDMVERNIADELSGRGDKWHLADFAMHAVWRAFKEFPQRIIPRLRRRIAAIATGYPYHFGGMTENHNLLQHAMRYLTAHSFPDSTFFDGRAAKLHLQDAIAAIRDWAEVWLQHGSEEWGSDIYENVNLLSLLNLYDFAVEPEIRTAAGAVLDVMAREMACNAMAGASSGAARRGYGCYRISARNSPSRPLHWLWFDSRKADFVVPWFCGGVLVAALSSYRPPSEAVRIAQNSGPLSTSRKNTRSFLPPNEAIEESTRVTTRLPGVQLSGTIIPASASRYTDFTWVAVFDEDAIVFATHPHLQPAAHNGADACTAETILRNYASGAYCHGAREWWVPGNMPPGEPGDCRPGYWQGHGAAPACWMHDRSLLSIWDIPTTEPLQYCHFFLPEKYFDKVHQNGHWVFARRNEGFIRIWTSTPLRPTTTGTWAGVEWRCQHAKVATFVEISSNENWLQWISDADLRRPVFDYSALQLSVSLPTGRATMDIQARTAINRAD